MPNIEDIQSSLLNEFGVIPVMAAEIEWYLRPIDSDKITPWQAKDTDINKYLSVLYDELKDVDIQPYSMDKEDGSGQVEIAFQQTKDISSLINDIGKLRDIAKKTANKLDLETDFSAKPYPSEYGNGMHIHIHLEDEKGNNLYHKYDNEMSDMLRHSLSGLLALMPEHMPLFAPNDNSWQRFEANKNAPVNASWGNNNRTVALRLPDPSSNKSGVDDIADMAYSRFRRIEHRVAGADANPEEAINSVLTGIEYGLTQKPELPKPIYGNASQEQYNLEQFKK